MNDAFDVDRRELVLDIAANFVAQDVLRRTITHLGDRVKRAQRIGREAAHEAVHCRVVEILRQLRHLQCAS